MSYKVVDALLTNNQYGNYGGRPAGTPRRTTAKILICIHITGNKNNLGVNAATNERNYANSHLGGPSAHDYINRDGSVVHAINPATHAAWSNGDVNGYNPATVAQPLIAIVIAGRAAGYNPNEMYYREVECVGYGAEYPLTREQKITVAQMIAADSKATGIAISRTTVGMHRDLNMTNRSTCPFNSSYETQINQIINLAKALRAIP
jgi:N-acetylmuramoyl-L-alanine amidase.